MLFKKLFIATLAALALVGCNDDNDIDNPVLQDAGDVNVVFATSSSEQAVTKSDVTFSTTEYDNFTPTDEVKEYFSKKNVADSEFVINHMTVFVFDEAGGLVKTSSFKDTQVDERNAEEANNSICEFGGIVLKEGTYNFILVGNLEKDNITLASEEGVPDFINYQNATINWTGAVSNQIAANTYLPMVKVLKDIKLTAHKVTASATLNLIGGSEVVTPENEEDKASKLSVSSPIQLTRLVARIQLKSLAFDWTNEDGVKPTVSTTLKNVYLANASNTVKLDADNEAGTGLVNGLSPEYQTLNDSSMISFGNVASIDESSLAKVVTNATVKNGEKIIWGETGEETQEAKKEELPLYFYAFPKKGVLSGENVHANWEIMMVLNCGVNDDQNVYYYVPIRDNTSNVVDVVANKVYNLNVRLIGQGSDIPGKKIEKVDVKLGLSVGEWKVGDPIIIDGTPTPVSNN